MGGQVPFARTQYGEKSAGVRAGRVLRGEQEAVKQGAVQVDEQEVTPAPATASPFADPGFEFAVAGAKLAGEFRCTECGYGAVVQRVLPQCPMCGGMVWESRTLPPPRFAD